MGAELFHAKERRTDMTNISANCESAQKTLEGEATKGKFAVDFQNFCH
jgi:hypothetical protein